MFGSYFTTGYASNNNTNNKSSTNFSSADHKNISSSNNITNNGTNSFLGQQQQAPQQHQHKAANSLFASSRLSDKKESSEGYRFTESSKQAEMKPTSNDSLTRSNLSRQGSYELRQSINFIAPHSDEKMRNSFLSQKNSCSAKHLTCHSPTSTAMFFPKSELIPKTFQKKLHEGNIWLGPKSISISNSNRSKPGNGYLSPTSRNSNIGLLGQNKFRSKHDQSSTLRASLPSQQYMSHTQEYEHEKEKQNSIFNESEIGEKMSQEKENDQYYFSQVTRKTPNAYDESNFLKQACSNSSSDINRNSLRISSEKRINLVQHFEQKGEPNNVCKSGESHIQTNLISNIKTTQESKISDVSQSQESSNRNYESSKIQQQFPSSKSKNLQQLLKTTDQQYQSTKMTYGCYLKPEMPSLPYYSTADPAIMKQTQSQQQVNSSSSPSEHINDILVSAETSSSKSSEHLLHPTFAKRFATEQPSTTKRPPPSQVSSNSHNIYSLQDSFFSPQNQNSERDENHYFSKEPTNTDSIRGSFQKHAQNIQPLAGSIVNVKKSKKKQDDAESLLLKSQQQDLNVVLMSSVSQGQSNSSHPTTDSKHIELDGDLLMEVQNLRRTNAVLTLKTESLQKEKNHFREIASRKSEECKHLNEQVIQLKAQLETLKASRINSHSSQEGTSTTPKQHHHALLLSAHNVSSTQLDTPRQVAASQAISNNFLFTSSNNLPAVRKSLNLPQTTIQDYENNSRNTQINSNNHSQLLLQTQENKLQKKSEINQYIQQQSSQASFPQHQKYNSPSLPLGIQVDCQFSPLNRAQVGTSTKSKDISHHSKNQGLSPIVNSQERSDFISNSILDDIPSAYSQQLNSSLVIQTSSSSQNFNQFQQHTFLIHNSQQLNIFLEQ